MLFSENTPPAPTPHPAGRPIAYSHHQSSVKRVEALGFLAGLHLMVLLLEERISCSSALLNRRLPTHPPPPLISPFTHIGDNLVPSSSPTPTSSPFHVVVVVVVAAALYASSVTILLGKVFQLRGKYFSLFRSLGGCSNGFPLLLVIWFSFLRHLSYSPPTSRLPFPPLGHPSSVKTVLGERGGGRSSFWVDRCVTVSDSQ